MDTNEKKRKNGRKQEVRGGNVRKGEKERKTGPF